MYHNKHFVDNIIEQFISAINSDTSENDSLSGDNSDSGNNLNELYNVRSRSKLHALISVVKLF